jgi:hypothetical protein
VKNVPTRLANLLDRSWSKHQDRPTDETPLAAPDVTALLHAWNESDLDAREQVMMLVYEELRQRAVAHMRRERQGHLLQPTALVHEAYLRLVDQQVRTANVCTDRTFGDVELYLEFMLAKRSNSGVYLQGFMRCRSSTAGALSTP